MASLITTDPIALRVLMTEELFDLKDHEPQATESISYELSEAPLAFNYEGENNRYILILYRNDQQSSMPTADYHSLMKILEAKQLSLADVALLNFTAYPSASFKEMKDFFACKSMVLLGIAPSEIALQGIGSNTIDEHEGVKILATFSFTEMANSVDKKRAFWAEMKKI